MAPIDQNNFLETCNTTINISTAQLGTLTGICSSALPALFASSSSSRPSTLASDITTTTKAYLHQPGAAASSSSGSSSTTVVGIVIAVCGGILVILVAALLWRRRTSSGTHGKNSTSNRRMSSSAISPGSEVDSVNESFLYLNPIFIRNGQQPFGNTHGLSLPMESKSDFSYLDVADSDDPQYYASGGNADSSTWDVKERPGAVVARRSLQLPGAERGDLWGGKRDANGYAYSTTDESNIYLEPKSFFHGCITEREAEERLQVGIEGAFLVRQTDADGRRWQLLARGGGHIHRIAIVHTPAGVFLVNGQVCSENMASLNDVVDYVFVQQAHFSIFLTQPVPLPPSSDAIQFVYTPPEQKFNFYSAMSSITPAIYASPDPSICNLYPLSVSESDATSYAVPVEDHVTPAMQPPNISPYSAPIYALASNSMQSATHRGVLLSSRQGNLPRYEYQPTTDDGIPQGYTNRGNTVHYYASATVVEGISAKRVSES